MHSDGGGCEGVVGWEDQGAPVLAVMVGCIWGTGEDVVPSVEYQWTVETEGEGSSYSRMLDSEGCAMMYGGGFSEIVLYSRVNCFLSVSSPPVIEHRKVPACWQLDWPSDGRGQGCGGYRSV